MIVLCTGMFRSGSTWSFNICKSILELDKQTLFSDYDESIETVFKNKAIFVDHILLKCHSVDDFGKMMIKHGCVKVVYTYRQPMDVIVSGMQVFNFKFEDVLGIVKNSLIFMEFQKKFHNVLNVFYDDIIKNPREIIQKINSFLGTKITDEDVKLIENKYSINNVRQKIQSISETSNNVIDVGFSIYDKTTLFHKNHVRSDIINWKEFLSDEQKETALSTLNSFVDGNGLFVAKN